ncbi:hypothetical protein E2562_029011, partial [Oryza meyeriana var. granulata]
MEANTEYVRPGLDLAAPPLRHTTAASSPSQGAPPRLDFISEQNWSKQCNNVSTGTSAVAAVDFI